MEGDVITLQDIFLFDFGMGVDEHGRFRGHLKATGVRPKFAEKLADLGIRLGPEVFQPEAFARRAVGRPVMRRCGAARAAARRVAARRSLGAGRARRRAAAGRRAAPLAIRAGRRHRPRRGRGRPSSYAGDARRPRPTSPSRENGDARRRHRRRAAGRPAAPLGIVLVIDTSASMEDGALIERVAKAAARASSTASGRHDQIAIVTFADDGRARPGLHHRRGARSTTPSTRSTPTARRRLYDGVVRAAGAARPAARRCSRTSSCSPTATTPTSAVTSGARAAVARRRRDGLRRSRIDAGDARRRRPPDARRPRPAAGTSRHDRRRRAGPVDAVRAGDRRRRYAAVTFTSPSRSSGVNDHHARRSATRRRRRRTSRGSVQVGAVAARAAGPVEPGGVVVPALDRGDTGKCARHRSAGVVGGRARRVRARAAHASRTTSTLVAACSQPYSEGYVADADERRRRRAPAAGADARSSSGPSTLTEPASPSARASSPRSRRTLERADLPLRAGRGAVLLRRRRRARRRCSCSSLHRQPARRAGRRCIVAPRPAGASSTSWPTRRRKKFDGAAARHAAAAVRHAAGRLLADAGRRGRVPGGRPTRWATSCAGSSPRPAWAGRSRSRSTAPPSGWTAPTSSGRSWPSASSGRSAATWPSC